MQHRLRYCHTVKCSKLPISNSFYVFRALVKRRGWGGFSTPGINTQSNTISPLRFENLTTALVIEKSKCVEINWRLTSVSITRLPEWSLSLLNLFTISKWHGLFGSGILNKSTVHSPCRKLTEKRTKVTRMFCNISWFDLWSCTNNELLIPFVIENKIWTESWILVHFFVFLYVLILSNIFFSHWSIDSFCNWNKKNLTRSFFCFFTCLFHLNTIT